MTAKTSLKFEGKIILFATNNVNKYMEARKVLTNYGITVGMLRAKSLEIQSDSLEEIAEKSAQDVFRKCKLPIIVEDAGLFIEALNGFPGPYAAYVYKTIGNEGLLRTMKNVKKRNAKFKSVIAYCSAMHESTICFEGEVEGEITIGIRKKSEASFGFDPIFKPQNSDKTFAEMAIDEKNKFSHRAMALGRFAEWYSRFSQPDDQ